MAWTLAGSTATTLLAALLFLRVAFASRRRAVEEPNDRRAMEAFSVWWFAIGGSTLCVAGLRALGLFAEPPLGLAIMLRALSLVLLSGAFWGLLSHVLYVRTGRDISRGLGALYAILTAAVLAQIAWARPESLVVTAWTVELAGPPGAQGASRLVLILAYLVPPVVASALYVGLARRASDAQQRARILTLGIGIGVWAFASLVARLMSSPFWEFAARDLLGAGVAAAFAHAYSTRILPPPRADEALRDRVRELV